MLSDVLERLSFLYFYAANFEDFLVDADELRKIKLFLKEWEGQDFTYRENYLLIARNHFSTLRKSKNPRGFLSENLDFLSLYLSKENKIALINDLQTFKDGSVAYCIDDLKLDQFLVDYWELDPEFDKSEGSKILISGNFCNWFRVQRETKASQLFRETFQISSLYAFIKSTELNLANEGIQEFQKYAYRSKTTFSPRLERLIEEICSKLSIENRFKTFIENSSIHNACILPIFSSECDSIIILSSKLVNELNDNELKFVLGHEIAHWLFNNNDISYVCNNSFSANSEFPSLSFEYLYSTWCKLAELSADRIGLLVCGSIDAAITALYRVHTDICPEKVGFDPQALLTEIKRENISPENFSFAREHTHPPLYLRIKALSFFDSSQLLRDWRIEGLFRSHDTKLSNQMDEIIGLLDYIDEDLNHFKILQAIGLGGVLLAQIDDEISQVELDNIHNILLCYVLNPQPVINFISNFLEENEVNPKEVFLDLLRQLSVEPKQTKYLLFQSFLEIALSDGALKSSETIMLLEIGSVLGIEYNETYHLIINSFGNKNFIEKNTMNHFDTLFKRKDPFLIGNRDEKMALASDTSTSVEDLIRLGRDLDPKVRMAVLMNESTPLEVKMELMDNCISS